MIKINDKEECCGCSACFERCPKQCIRMCADEEGFLYPNIFNDLCIDCGLCEKVCPVINQCDERKPKKVYAVKNPNEKVRMKSSSGGIFTMLAERTINAGGIVFGAKFDNNWEIVHDYTQNIEGIVTFCGSKYVQSQIGSCFKEAENFLKAGRNVLFTGTLCQIAGLKKFLRKEYDKLITVGVVCHGVPSPEVWREYLKVVCEENKKSISDIEKLSFRDKRTGWKDYSFTLWYKDGKEYSQKSSTNIYMRGFLSDIYLRPSCYACPAKSGKCGSDIILADFWGVGNYFHDFDDDKGCGLVLINSFKGDNIYSQLQIDRIETSYVQAIAGNPAIERSAIKPKERLLFWKRFTKEGIACISSICVYMKPSIKKRIITKIKQMVKK